MKKNKIYLLTATSLAALLMLTGCKKETADGLVEVISTSSSANTTASSTLESLDETLPTEVIGEKTKAEDEYQLILNNKTTKDIQGVAVRDMTKEKFSDNLMAEGNIFTNENQAVFYFSPETLGIAAETEEKSGFVINSGYDVEITFADGEQGVIHGLPFDDVAEATLLYEENILYIEYTMLSTNQWVSTFETEKMAQEIADNN
ncbi:hypothetical protein M2139_002282 [Enterococcus sp. PF1-24]|uniref:hypothetical protein n=1 Tax=unclassified Enterococcus TaxID=2608891 RepID=UPI0024759DE0|nr:MULTISPECIES: hypothetical protein [unclassified Enterococcus]MDH6365289.1 hypothetical protein [Enterococcus sp. PFB1-1]MDH6402381.1 hypothetical protein [Enterococcus sp. PF1-24]